jgi:outer membrane protein
MNGCAPAESPSGLKHPMKLMLHKTLFAVALGALASSCASTSSRVDTYVGPLNRGISNAPPAVAASVGETNEVAVTVEEAILVALENNRALKLERLTPEIQRTFVDEQRAAFDPVLAADLSQDKNKAQRTTSSGGSISTSEVTTTAGDLSVNEYLPTGTRISVGANAAGQDGDAFTNAFDSVEAGISITQSLLQGGGTEANLASLRQARLDTLSSEYELRGFAQSVVAQVEEKYWDYVLAQRQIDIFSNSLKLAEDQLAETQERIKVGSLAEVEIAAAQAEVASRREGLINACSALETSRLQMLRLLNLPGTNLWSRELVSMDQPHVPDVELDDVSSYVQLARMMRPELNQARLGIQRNDLEIVKTKNGLLPRLDLFINLGSTGYSDSFGKAASNVDGSFYDAAVGVQLQVPLGNREARARHRRALLDRDQSAEALENLQQLVEVDVRTAYVEVKRTREQISATAATRKFQEESARAEAEKFRVGKSTALLVAQAERNLLASQIAELLATINHLQALVELYRMDGSLLERRGIRAPGREPVTLSDR